MSETYTVTLEVDVDPKKLEKQIRTGFTGRSGKEIKGTVEADPKEVLMEAVTGAMLSGASAPEPVPHAIESSSVSHST